jgi:hypothetical protein
MWLSLGLLDFAMDKASNNLCNQVANQEFMQTLIQILNAKEVHLEVSFYYSPTFKSADQKQNRVSHPKMGTSLRKERQRATLQ